MAAQACGGGSGPTGPSERPNLPPTGVLAGAGDIAWCGPLGGMALTARLLDAIDGTIFTAGDNAYLSGRAEEFLNCYDPHWGRFKSRTRPIAGNHDYESPGAGPYYDYFGAAAGPAGLGYYSYTVGPWLILALNSEIEIGTGSPQLAWLDAELTNWPGRCVAALMHRPRFTSGSNGDNPDLTDIWRVLYARGVELVISGHDHLYERFAPQDAEGRPDPARGIRLFIVGTGGAPLGDFVGVRRNSEVRGRGWGIIRLNLQTDGYAWEFKPAAGSTVSDSGVGSCH